MRALKLRLPDVAYFLAQHRIVARVKPAGQFVAQVERCALRIVTGYSRNSNNDEALHSCDRQLPDALQSRLTSNMSRAPVVQRVCNVEERGPIH